MLIQEFARTYCQDLIEKNNSEKKLIDLGEYPYEVLMTDSLGEIVPAIIIDTFEVPIRDILTMEKSDFVKFYTTPTAGQAYDTYLSNLCMLEGDEVIAHIRNQLAAEFKRLSKPTEMWIDV